MFFENTKSTINEHIKNIYKEGELLESDTLTKFGNPEFPDKPTNYFIIIPVGYRVKSKNGIAFRKWATKILKCYAVNQNRLEHKEEKWNLKYIQIISQQVTNHKR